MTNSFIRDNHSRGKVGDFLKEVVSSSSDVSIVSAYFTIYAYYRLKDNLDGINKLRFLFGERRGGFGGISPDTLRSLAQGASFRKEYQQIKEIEMKRYKNLSGNSAVAAYKIAKDSVTVRFATHSVYRYSNQSAGSSNIRQMKSLALAGKGLSTFIDTNVKKRFARKIR